MTERNITSRDPASVSPKYRPSLRLYFNRLLNSFGRQGWWPTTAPGQFKPQYTSGKSLARLSEQEMFEVCLGAMLTQNTNWANVEKVISGLQEKRLLRFEALSALPPARLESLIRSSGYYRQKAKRIKNFLSFVRRETNGSFRDFLSGPLSAVRTKLLSLSGVGPETADSMLLYAAGRPVFVVDAYTRRIASRWGCLKGDEPYDVVRSYFETNLPRSASVFGEMHALLVKLVKVNCRVAPLCGSCPVRRLCRTGKIRIQNQQRVH